MKKFPKLVFFTGVVQEREGSFDHEFKERV